MMPQRSVTKSQSKQNWLCSLGVRDKVLYAPCQSQGNLTIMDIYELKYVE